MSCHCAIGRSDLRDPTGFCFWSVLPRRTDIQVPVGVENVVLLAANVTLQAGSPRNFANSPA